MTMVSARMRNIVLASAIAFAFAAAPAYAHPDVITLESGHSTIIPAPGLTRVAVGDGHIAGVVPIGTSELIVNGKNPGTTSLFIWSGGERSSFIVKVTAEALDAFAQTLASAISDPAVRVHEYGNDIIVSGTVPDMAQWVNQNTIVSSFQTIAKEQDYHIADVVGVQHSMDTLQEYFANSPTAHDLEMEPDGRGDIIVSGYVRDQVEAERVIGRAQVLAGTYLSDKGDVIDRLSLEHPTQISIKVDVLEVDKTAEGDLGLELQSSTYNPSTGTYTYSQPSFTLTENTASSAAGKALNLGAFLRTAFLAPTLNLVLQSGHARDLASPNLITTSGNLATFLVGGQIPYVYSTGLGQVSVNWQTYGVQLNVTPTILPNGSIDCKLTPDISNLDYSNEVEINGFYVPALTESKLSTDVIATPGESIVLGGLLERVSQKTISKIPVLSSIPILGKLFQSVDYQNSETDAVFVLTPEVVSE